MCTKYHNHMMHGSWNKECNRQNFLSLWTVFYAVFYPLYWPRKSKFWKNEKSTWRYYHFTNVYHKWQSYDIWFFRYGVQQTKFFVILDLFLPFYPSNKPKTKILKNWKKKCGDIIILHMCTKNYDQMMYLWFLRYVVRRMYRRMDRRTDRWKKWHIEVGAPPKKRNI